MADCISVPCGFAFAFIHYYRNHERENVLCKANYCNKLRQTKSYFMHVPVTGIGMNKNEKGFFFSKFTICGFEQSITLEVGLKKMRV